MKASLLAIGLLMPAPLMAQAAMPASEDAALSDTSAYPAVVSVRTGKVGFYYADAQGRTVYAMSSRTARGRSGVTLTYCIGPCEKIWTPLAAPADAKPVGRWKVVVAAQGPQWSYKDDLVFTYNADKAPGDMAGDGYDDLWNVIAHVPPAPKLTAPASVTPRYVDGGYVLSDANGHALFTAGTANDPAPAAWAPLAAGMAARDIGDWTIQRIGDQPQWLYRGKPVFVSREEAPSLAPAGGTVLRL